MLLSPVAKFASMGIVGAVNALNFYSSLTGNFKTDFLCFKSRHLPVLPKDLKESSTAFKSLELYGLKQNPRINRTKL